MGQEGSNNHIPKIVGPVKTVFNGGRNTPATPPPQQPTYVKPTKKG